MNKSKTKFTEADPSATSLIDARIASVKVHLGQDGGEAEARDADVRFVSQRIIRGHVQPADEAAGRQADRR